MANVKISALPSYTGSAADLRWFVMNNSGQTETFKYSGYSSPLKTVGTNNRIINSSYDSGLVNGDNSIILGCEIPFISGGSNNVIIGGFNCSITGSSSYSAIIAQAGSINGGFGNIVLGGSGSISGSYNATLGGASNTITGSTTYGAIIGGNGNTLSGASNSTMIGCVNRTSTTANTTHIESLYMYGTFKNPTYTGSSNDLRWFLMTDSGQTTTYKFSGYSSPFLSTGTTNKVIQPVDDKALLQVGSGNTFNDYSGTNLKNALVVGNRNKVDGAADKPVMFIGDDLDSQQFGSYALHIGNGHYASGSYNISVGDSGIEMNGSYGLIIGSGGGSQAHKSWGTYNFNLGQSNQTQGITGAYTFGKNHTISGGEWGGIFGGIGGSISSGNYNSILGGENNSITGGTNIAMIGCSGRTADASNTTFVENLQSFGQSYQGYFDNGSGSTFTINWNNGNTQKMSFTGAGGITCNNTQTGAHYRMVINNPNGYTPTSFTAAGRTIKFNGGSFVVYSGESICELFITNDSVFVNQLGLFS